MKLSKTAKNCDATKYCGEQQYTRKQTYQKFSES